METEKRLCECGCGEEVKPPKRFIQHHQNRGRRVGQFLTETRPMPLCQCGCGLPVTRRGNRYLHGHFSRTLDHKDLAARVCGSRLGMKHTDEARKKQSDAKKRFFAAGGKPWNHGLTKDVHPSVGLNNNGAFTTASHYERTFPTSSTTIEAIFQIALWQRDIPFLFNVPVRHICRPDFLFPDARIIVNLDAPYWHHGREDKDAFQDDALRAEGWLVWRWEEKPLRADLQGYLDLLESAYRARRNQFRSDASPV